MKRSSVLIFLALFVASPFHLVAAQPSAKKIPRIGYLSGTDPATDSRRAEGIQRALRELGYIEGQNIAFEHRYTQGKVDRARELTAELVRSTVNVIVVSGGFGVIQEARKATKTIPIVMAGLNADPVEAGLVESLARPGGNVTGLTTISRELGGKRLELLKETVTKLARVGVLHDPTIQRGAVEVKEVLPAAARGLGLTVRAWEVRAADAFESVFTALSKERPDGLYVSSGGLMNRNQKRIAALALKNRLPSVFSNSESVHVGGLMYYGADQAYSYQRVAWYVDKILKGAKPAHLPVEQPTKFELVINLNSAKQIGLTVPPNVLARADRVIR